MKIDRFGVSAFGVRVITKRQFDRFIAESHEPAFMQSFFETYYRTIAIGNLRIIRLKDSAF